MNMLALFFVISVIAFCNPVVVAKKTRHTPQTRNEDTRRGSSLHYGKDKQSTSRKSNNKAKIQLSGIIPDNKAAIDFQKKCKKAVPSNFSPAQAEEFCSAASNIESLTCVKDSRSGTVKLSFQEVKSLCIGARTNYPLECYKTLSSKDRKVYGLELCTGAESALAYQCWRTLSSIQGLVRKVDPADIVSFCKSSVVSQAQVECVHNGLKQDRLSLSKSLMACQNMSADTTSTAGPIYEHIEAPKGVVDDTYFSKCVSRVTTSSEWAADADALCIRAASPQQVDTIVQCAIDIRKLKVLTVSETSHVCQAAGWVEEQMNYTEANYREAPSHAVPNLRGRVATCVYKAFKEITTSSSTRTSPSADLVISACKYVHTSMTGSCIASFSNKKMQSSITPPALLKLCSASNSLSRLSCLEKQRSQRPSRSRGPITVEEVHTCISMKSQVQTLRIDRFESYSRENPQEIIAGHFFSLSLSMIDQWGALMSGTDHESIRVIVEVERSHVDDAGAVLFGTRWNSSDDGSITFRRLMVTQPGPIQLKISMEDESLRSSSTSLPDGPRVLLFKFLVHAAENPDMGSSDQCLFVFDTIQSPVLHTQSEVDAWYNAPSNVVIGRLPSSNILAILSCSEVFKSWAVTVHVSPIVSSSQGDIIDIQFRSGIESVWTGRGLPRSEMNSYARLDIPLGCTDSKRIRSAYHKKSLKWHPDRWTSIFISVADADEDSLSQPLEGAAVSLYKLAVQEAFELIAEAYEDLMSNLEAVV
mmetsp:Transcript_4723/g.8910  ORF Transcript_4723/g.8910 Transcript_4723/m.8910 type:complete len:758 (-) Transcript_4723:84-2357(-)